MSVRNSLANKKLRREKNLAHKAVPTAHELHPDRNKYAQILGGTVEIELTEEETE